MTNEWLLLLCAITSLFFIFVAARLGRTWLLCSIVANLSLVVVFVANLVEIFGFVTNVGNVFYASVFVATHILLERYGRHEGLLTIGLGAGVIAFFVAMSQFAIQFNAISITAGVASAGAELFSFAPRLFLGSILAYMVSQYINVGVFCWLSRTLRGAHLWLRSNAANMVAQAADSALFFSIVFFGLQGGLIFEVMLMGWAVKVAVVALGTPFIYLDDFLSRQRKLLLRSSER